jgi:hypothetical protein
MVLLWRSNLSRSQTEFIQHDDAVQKSIKKISHRPSTSSSQQRPKSPLEGEHHRDLRDHSINNREQTNESGRRSASKAQLQ